MELRLLRLGHLQTVITLIKIFLWLKYSNRQAS